MDFAVVELMEDSSVEIVPSLWITGTDPESCLCYWPPYKGEKLVKSIKKVELPNSKIWECYDARVLHYYGTKQ